jgi:iron complex outermembrane receptor protein
MTVRGGDTRRTRHGSPFNPFMKSLLLNLLGVLFLACLASTAAGQTAQKTGASGTIAGRIFNPTSGEYVRNAQVRVESTGQVTVSESSGRYRLTNVPLGQQTVSVTFTGYQVESAVVQVSAGATATQDFSLTSTVVAGSQGTVIKLPDFVIVSQREGNAKAIMDQRQSMNITNTVASDIFGDDGEGNVAEFLKHLPGVAMEGSFGEPRNIGLRGLGSEYTSVTIDGAAISSADPTSQGGVNSRAFTFENASLSSMDSIEVLKTISADMDANAPAGTINLRTKRAFDQSGRRISWQANLAGHSSALHLRRTVGPGESREYKLRPGGQFEFSDSFFNRRVGVVLNVSESNIYQEADIVTLTFNRVPTATDPRPVVISQMLFNQSVRFNERFATTLNTDFKATENLTLTFNTIYNWSDLWNPQRNVLFTTGARNTVRGDNPLTSFTTSAANANATGTPTNVAKLARTVALLPRFEYACGNLTIEGRGTYSRSFTWNDPLGHRGTARAISGASTLNHTYRAERGSDNAYDWAVTQLTGPDWAAGYTNAPLGVLDDFTHSTNNIYNGDVSARLRTEIARMPFEFKAGMKRQDEHYTYGTRLNYSGLFNYAPGGTNIGFNSFPSGFPHEQKMMNTTIRSVSGRGIFMPNLEAIAARFVSNPEEFTHGGAIAGWTIVNITGPRVYDEMVDAAYLMGTGTRGKAKFRAGLRWEQTAGDATMLGKRPDAEVRAAGYQLGPTGNATTIEGLHYQYLSVPRIHREKTYGDLFPSASLKYSFSKNLDLQLGYSHTIRRPAFRDVAGVFQVNEQSRTVSAPNINLEPEYSDNLSARLAYYFEPVGVLAVNFFANDVRNLMIANEITAEQYGYQGEEDLSGYIFNTTTNSPNKIRMRGVEFEYSQSLSFLPGIFRGLGVRASYTHNEANAIIPRMIPNQVSGGINFSWRRFSTSWNVLWSDTFATVNDGTQWRRHRAELAGNINVRLTKSISAFVSGRNITNTRDINLDRFPNLPTVWRSHAFYGATYTCGIKGRF